MMLRAYPKVASLRHANCWAVGLAMLFSILARCSESRAVEVTAKRRLMAVEWVVTVHDDSAAAAEAAAEAALDRVAEIEKVLSDYDRSSEVSRLMAAAAEHPGRSFPVSEDLAHTLRQSLDFSARTGGAFDVTVGPLTALWRQSRKTGRLPHPSKRAAAQAATGSQVVTLTESPQGPRVALADPATRLDFGGIGMGYAIDAAMALLAEHGITSAMIDASGDIAVSGPPPGRDHWRVAVPPLMRTPAAAATDTLPDHDSDIPMLALVHAAVATSGDAYQAVVIDGQRYSHIVDPRTGLGVVGPTAVTVIATDATTADALSTATSVLGPVAGRGVIETIAGAAARFSWVEENRLHVEASPGWSGYLERR